MWQKYIHNMCEYVRYFFRYSKYNICENINKDKKTRMCADQINKKCYKTNGYM